MIDLRCNEIGIKGIQYLADALSDHKVFYYHFFTNNMYVFLVSQSPPTIYLQLNEISIEGMQFLPDALRINRVILIISLKNSSYLSFYSLRH
jgi:hypothetical protein